MLVQTKSGRWSPTYCITRTLLSWWSLEQPLEGQPREMMCCFQGATYTLCQWSLCAALSPGGRIYESGSRGVQLERIHSSHSQWPTCFLGNFCFWGTRPNTGFNYHLYGDKCQIYHLTCNYLMGSKSEYTNTHPILKLNTSQTSET